MGVATITPDDPLLQFAGYVNLRRTRERASMDRYFANDLRGAFSDGPAQSPGTRVWWRTDAEEVAIVLRYTGGLPPGRCSERCAVTNAGECYAADTCRNRCDVTLRVDGAAQPAATRHADGEYAGEERVVWRAVPARAAEREYEVVMPWGAVVELVRLELRGSGWGAPRLLPPPPARSFVYAAYGDSITHGWCGATPYPELIAARHGWQSVNLGIPGMGAVGGAHGAAIAAVGAQLVSVAIGINDIFWCGAVGEPLRQTLVGIRARQPRVPLVVVTPTPSYMDGKRCTRPDGKNSTWLSTRSFFLVRRATLAAVTPGPQGRYTVE